MMGSQQRISQEDEWWDLIASGLAWTFQEGDPMESPFKSGVASPLRSVPGGDDPQIIKQDVLHNFNLGVGGDLAIELWHYVFLEAPFRKYRVLK